MASTIKLMERRELPCGQVTEQEKSSDDPHRGGAPLWVPFKEAKSYREPPVAGLPSAVSIVHLHRRHIDEQRLQVSATLFYYQHFRYCEESLFAFYTEYFPSVIYDITQEEKIIGND